uniref:Uncharacterized protein n=1 Tax=Lactuca sativa TaxID=4236 RepID=A0A9R1VEH0_LACSA|nr:hypothetical protein LSAT_V11C500247740 [Lactuca sativa]
MVELTRPESFDILHIHSKATMLLIINNAGQGVLWSSSFKYANTILKKYSSIVATIFKGFTYAALFGHTLTINSMHQVNGLWIPMEFELEIPIPLIDSISFINILPTFASFSISSSFPLFQKLRKKKIECWNWNLLKAKTGITIKLTIF